MKRYLDLLLIDYHRTQVYTKSVNNGCHYINVFNVVESISNIVQIVKKNTNIMVLGVIYCH